MTHGRKVERAIVFWHGFTSCPQQFYHLGQIFYELGYNVLIPRLPHHGSTDRLGPDQTQLTAEKLISLVDKVVDLAHGLGDQLTVAGFSGGGVLAGWTAQHRPDVDRVVIIAASFGLKVIPTPLITPAVKLLLTWPNSFQWWDPKLMTEVQGPPYGYWRFSTRALGQILRLGLAVRSAARRSKPAVGSILVMTNANDWAVDNPLAAEIVSRWRNNGASNVQIYEFPAELNLLHDLLPPEYPAQRVDMVYPILVDLINNQPQAGAAAKQELS
jgi:carboxylesterase